MRVFFALREWSSILFLYDSFSFISFLLCIVSDYPYSRFQSSDAFFSLLKPLSSVLMSIISLLMIFLAKNCNTFNFDLLQTYVYTKSSFPIINSATSLHRKFERRSELLALAAYIQSETPEHCYNSKIDERR